MIPRLRSIAVIVLLLLFTDIQGQNKILIPMDLSQTDHLRAYGVTYRALSKGLLADWLLNYRGGSFAIDRSDEVVLDCRLQGVYFEELDAASAVEIYSFVQQADQNMDVVRMEKAPKVAVYVPPGFHPWDDAVTLALEYAGIPYDKFWNEEILRGDLAKYDWLHLHHEDFTGQYGKFYASYANAQWYIENQRRYEADAQRLGYTKVSKMMLDVAKMIKNFVSSGGFLFAMCSATDSYDISLSAEVPISRPRCSTAMPPIPRLRVDSITARLSRSQISSSSKTPMFTSTAISISSRPRYSISVTTISHSSSFRQNMIRSRPCLPSAILMW